jgi:hypothetical protein
MPISKSRRQLSLDSSRSREAKRKTQQFSTTHRNLLPFATPPQAIRRSRVVFGSSTAAARCKPSFNLPRHTSHPTWSGESLPSNPGAGPARIIRKELAGNEENLPKQNCLPLAPARTHHVLLLAGSRIDGVCSSGRRFAVGERRERLDASVHNDHRSRPLARFDCGRRFDLRFW